MDHRLSRRQFLTTVALVAPGALLLDGCATRDDDRHADRAHIFFTDAEAAFVDAALSRLIPADDLGPGAREADVLEFIDIQLAGAYGRAERWYMDGPWPTGTGAQGYQLKFTPAELYRTAIAGIDSHCQDKYGKHFAGLSGAQQDDVLHAVDRNEVKLQGLSSKTFFTLLWQNTQEGFLADPVYGGNRDFAGWQLIGFPGPRYNYVDEIGKYGEPYKEPFVSISGVRLSPKSQGA